MYIDPRVIYRDRDNCQWLGEDQRTVITQTTKGTGAQSDRPWRENALLRRLYRSTNGGETWNDITDFFKGSAFGSQKKILWRQSMCLGRLRPLATSDR